MHAACTHGIVSHIETYKMNLILLINLTAMAQLDQPFVYLAWRRFWLCTRSSTDIMTQISGKFHPMKEPLMSVTTWIISLVIVDDIGCA